MHARETAAKMVEGRVREGKQAGSLSVIFGLQCVVWMCVFMCLEFHPIHYCARSKQCEAYEIVLFNYIRVYQCIPL